MATISITQSKNMSSETFRLSGMFDSEKKTLTIQHLPQQISYQQTDFCKGKRVFDEISQDKSVVTKVDHQLERVNRVNYEKRQKIDNVKPVTTATATGSVNRSCLSMSCQGRRPIDLARASSVDSTGRCSSKSNRHSPRPPIPATGDACGEESFDIEVIDYDAQLSPKKALHIAMLKSRFSDVILKAQNRLLFNGEKGDSLKMQHDKELFEKKQQEAKIRVAAEVALKKSQEAKLKLQRQKEREAARIALEKMVKNVEIYECQDIMRDFEMLISRQP